MATHAQPPQIPDGEIHVHDFDEARRLLTRLYGTVVADLVRGAESPFSWRVRSTSLGSATVIVGDVETGMNVQAGERSRYVLGMVRRGHYDVRCRGGQFIAAVGEVGFMASPGSDMSVRAPESTQTFNVSIEESAFVSHLAALAGAPVDRPLRFAPRVDLRHGPGADILKLAGLVREASERPDGRLASPYVAGHLREALYGVLLVGLESTASYLFRKPPPRTDRRVVKQVEEYLVAHASEPVSIAALAELVGVGIRSLERSFKAVHGCSIREFLKGHRLDLAYRCLTAGEPGMTVTQVLHASGFGHAGEFSAAYRLRFGERPSSTLERTRSRA
jgi:AraC-like DNA-binding protein